MAIQVFNADSPGVTATGMTKVGSTFVLDHTTGSGGDYLDNPNPTAVATSSLNALYLPEFGFDTDLTTTGAAPSNSWVPLAGSVTNQRLCVDLGEKYLIAGFRISNGHDNGGDTDRGVKDFDFKLSNDAGDFTGVYDTDIALEGGATGQATQHTSNSADPEWEEFGITEISARYCIFKFANNWGNPTYMQLRRIEILIGVAGPGIVTIPADFGVGKAADFSTSGVSVTGLTTTFQSTDDAGATNFVPVTPESLLALQSRANTDLQLTTYNIYCDGTANDVFLSFSTEDQTPDVTPPDDPTGAKQVSGDIWGMWWEQSPEGSDIISQLRRVIDGTTEYLANVGGLPVWQEAIPTTWYTFSRDSLSTDVPFNAFETDNVAATSVIYYVRFVDSSNNNSSWIAFSEAGSGDSPDAPIITSVLGGDGEFTATFTTTLPGDKAYIRYKKTTETDWAYWPTSETGSGSITVTGVTNSREYNVEAYVDNDGCISLTSNMLHVTPMDPAAFLYDIIRYRVQRVSDGEGGFVDVPANPLVIYPTLNYDDVRVTASLRVEDDVLAEDVLAIYGETYYRVRHIRRNTSGLMKTLVLEKIERPVGMQNTAE